MSDFLRASPFRISSGSPSGIPPRPARVRAALAFFSLALASFGSSPVSRATPGSPSDAVSDLPGDPHESPPEISPVAAPPPRGSDGPPVVAQAPAEPVLLGFVVAFRATTSFRTQQAFSLLDSSGAVQDALRAYSRARPDLLPDAAAVFPYVRPHGSDAMGFLLQLRGLPEIPRTELPLLGRALSRRLEARAHARVPGRRVVSVEPHFDDSPLPGPVPFTTPAPGSPLARHGTHTGHPEWPLVVTGIFEAWRRVESRTRGQRPGEGVVVGVPDTGLLPHPEIWGDGGARRLDLAHALNFMERVGGRPSPGAPDPLRSRGIGVSPAHGTRVASLLVSPRGPQPGGDEAGAYVTGVVPGATLVPVRVADSTVLGSSRALSRLAEAIEFLSDDSPGAPGAKVISISLGGMGPFEPRLHRAVRRAKARGAIIVAAAGNVVPPVVWPARYDEVVSVGAGNIHCEPWEQTSPGARIDVLAPGEDVWHAFPLRRLTRPTGAPDALDWVVRRGEGASIATPFVAGAAALWMQYFGFEVLAARYGKEYVADVFLSMLHRGGHARCPGVDTRRYGAGFLDATRLLDDRLLPSDGELASFRRARYGR